MEKSKITLPTATGGRGENIYTVKTVYTDIVVDGEKDAAYDLGVHLSGFNPKNKEYYESRETNLEVYMVRGQNGRLYVYGEVTDPDVFFKKEYISGKVDEQDSVNFHIDYTGLGHYMIKAGRALACEDESVNYARKQPDTKVKLTEKGFNFEFSLDNEGAPFAHGQTVNFAFYYHDVNDWKSDESFTKNLAKLPSRLDPISPGGFYMPLHYDPDPRYNDSLIFSEADAAESLKVEPAPKSGDALRDILSGAATVSVIAGGKRCTVQTLNTAKAIVDRLNSLNARAFFVDEATLNVDLGTNYEIIVNAAEGGKNRFFGALGANEYAVEINEKSIVLYGAVEKTAAKAKEIFDSYIDRIIDGEPTSALPALTQGAIEELPAGVPMLPKLDHITDVGDDAYMLMNLDAALSDLGEYKNLLEKAGYTFHTENEMGGTKTATYSGFGNVVNVTLTSGENKCLRVIAEPLSKTALPPLEAEPCENKVTPKATLLSPNELCMIYRLENGEYIVLDAGGWRAQKNIYDILAADGNENPVIAAWIISHYHQDHIGSIVTMIEDETLFPKITVRSIVYNFPQKLVLATSKFWLDRQNLAKWQSLVDKTGATVYQARTGQKFPFPGAELEVLWTFEDLMPFNLFWDDTNITCTGYRLTIAGQTHLLLGDTSEGEMAEAVKNLGDYLKSDFVQLAHHGLGSLHSPQNFYEKVDAPVAFIPGPPARGKAEKWAAANAKEVYIRDEGTVTLDLPHTVKQTHAGEKTMDFGKYIGIDNGISALENAPLTAPTMIGVRGEAIYTVKTIYTDITVDGVKDPAYDHGVHLKGLTPREVDYYKDRPTDLEIWMIRGQNGRLYVYGEVTDPDLFFKEEYIRGKLDECDGVNLYFDYNAIGVVMNKACRVLACEDSSVNYGRKRPDTRVILTDKGFNFEFSIDQKGQPFEHADTVGFSFYYHDTNNWKSDDDYTKNLLKLTSPIDDITPEFYTPIPEYFAPQSIYTDTIVFSAESASERAKILEDKCSARKSGDMMRDIINGSSSVGVVAGGRDCAVQTMFAANTIYTVLNKGGANAYFVNEGAGSIAPKFDCEIIVNKDESGKNHHFGALGANEYAVEICDGYVLIYGAVEKTISKAKEIFLSYVERIANGGSTSDLPKLTIGTIDELPSNVPMLKGLDHITDVGDDAYMLMNRNATENDLVDYVKTLEAAGYKLHAHNQMGGTRTATYVGFGNVINLSLTTGENHCLRVVAEPISKTTLPALTPEKYEKKVTPQVTLLDPTNLCMIYRLENGEFLILDSGQAGHADKIFNILTKDGDEHPIIAAWFFSHHHQDHTGSFIALVENEEYLKNVTIRKIIYNFPQKLVLDTSVAATDQANLKKWQSILDKTGAEIYQARTGQKYFFAGAELELTWTYEDLMPFNLFIDDTNVTCTGYRLTIAGQTHMLLGDTSEGEMREAVKNLGKYVKSDFVQLAHHGHGSVHSPFELYENVDAPVVFIPGVSASGKAEKWAADNAKEVYIRSKGTVTLDLPHIVK